MSDRARLVSVGLELADVVQQRARDGDVAVDPREGRADRADRLRDAEAVLEQPVAVGLVVVLGRRRRRGSPPTARESSPNTRSSRIAQVRLLDRGEQLADLAFHLLDAARGAVAQVLRIDSCRARLRAGHAG